MTGFRPLPAKIQQFLDSLSDTDLQTLAAQFATGQAEMQQWNTANARGYQVWVEGGTAYIGDLSISAEVLEQALENLLCDRQLPTIGIPQNLPYSGVTEFIGRDDELNQVHEQLQPESIVAISAVSGMGGVGKTELALQYAQKKYRVGAYPGGLCWLRAREDVGAQIISFVRSHLDLTPPENLELVEKVRWCWQRWRDGAVLLIFDDVQQYEEIEPFLPPPESRFKVLLTTRSRFGSPVQILQLDVLSAEKALEFLRSLVEDARVDQQLARSQELCAWLGYLPLGVELVGRYLAKKPDVSIEQLWQRLQEKRLDARALKQAEPGMTASLGVTAAFELSWQSLDAATQQVAALLSLFALVEIPWRLVEQCLPAVDAEDLEEIRDEALLGANLLKRVDQGIYQLHQLVREFFVSKRSQQADRADLVQRFYQVMIAEAERVRDKPVQSLLKESTATIAHLQAAQSLLELSAQKLDVSNYLHWMAELYFVQGRYEQAKHYTVQALEIRQHQLGDGHPQVAEILNNLGVLSYEQGHYLESEAFFLQALEIRERCLGSDHPDVAMTLIGLSRLHVVRVRYAEAETLLVRALEIQQQLGQDLSSPIYHSHILDNLANLYALQGRYAEAESLFVQALEIVQRQLGQDHPTTANSLGSLANLYISQGRYAEAESLYGQALEIQQQQLGQDHLAVAGSLASLANLHIWQGRYAEAEPLFLQALEVQQRHFGQNHPTVANSLASLANLYESQGRYAEAEPLFLQALEIQQRYFGQEHPTVANSLASLANLYRSQGRYAEAEPLFLQALEAQQRHFGQNHPTVASTLNNLAEAYRYQKRYAEAEPLYMQSLDIYQQQWGEDHPSVATSLNNLALLYRAQARYDDAESFFLQSRAILQKKLPPNHPYIARSWHNQAGIYDKQARYREAESFYLQAFSIFATDLGEHHPWTQETSESYRSLLQKALQDYRTDELSDDPMTQEMLRQIREGSEM